MKQKDDLELIRRSNRRKLAIGGVVFAVCFLAVLLTAFVVFIAVKPHSWQGYVKVHFDELLYLALSTFFLLCIGYFYFFYEDTSFLCRARNIIFYYVLIVFSAAVCWVFGKYINIYCRPYAMFSLLCIFLLGRKHTLFLNFLFVFLMFAVDLFTNSFPQSISTEVYSTTLIGFVSGTFAVFFGKRVRTRFGILLAGIFVAVPTVIVISFFKLPNPESDWIDYVSALGFQIMGCVCSAVLALAAMPVFEVLFNRLTTFRLREITSPSAPLLKRLRDEAPGTFNHSLIVAQLAETSAVAIGENAELARAAAYYHDVGKLKQPDCFTENQTGYNLHDEITPELSADIIRSHARDGYELLTARHMPKIIADVAREHHGTLPIKYFYDKALRYSGDADIKDYSYLGPIPQTKIAAIIMVADAAEAATRAASDRSPESVEKVCRAIIEERMDLGQFDECDITIRELNIIKMTLVEALSGVHHHRVEYPNIQFNRDREVIPFDGDRYDD